MEVEIGGTVRVRRNGATVLARIVTSAGLPTLLLASRLLPVNCQTLPRPRVAIPCSEIASACGLKVALTRQCVATDDQD